MLAFTITKFLYVVSLLHNILSKTLMQLNGRDSSILNLPTTKLKPSNSLILVASTENMHILESCLLYIEY